MNRPYFKLSIVELESLFDRAGGDLDRLKAILVELSHRETKRAENLRQKINSVIAVSNVSKSTTPPDTSSVFLEDSIQINVSTNQYAKQSELPEIKNIPTEILTNWIAQEVLSPPSFVKPENLVSGDLKRIARITDVLPWQNGELSRPKQTLYYQVILGTILLEPAVKMLLDIYTDSREDFVSARGEAIIASIMVDKNGKPVEEDPINVASFAWGLPKALNGNLRELGEWANAEKQIIQALSKRLIQYDEDGKLRPLNIAVINKTSAWLTQQLNIPTAVLKPPAFIVRSYQFFIYKNPPEAILLNSFFLNDLLFAKDVVKQKKSSPNLKLYLGETRLTSRGDLMKDQEVLSVALDPAKFPKGSWPTSGRHPLVLLQQAAVNLTSFELKTEGISGVNGPPGTGKTTLLRDIYADVITKRAEQLARFDDPQSAFNRSGESIIRSSSRIELYEVDDSLKGFEMIVASSNNKAVENVTVEIPSIDAIADNASDLRYFKSISDNVLKRKTWGMGAAVLGNGENKNQFKKLFWADEDLGMNAYLRAASGEVPQFTDMSDPANPVVRIPQVAQAEDPPANRNEAIKRWQSARENFKRALSKVDSLMADIKHAYNLSQRFNERSRNIAELEAQLNEIKRRELALNEDAEGLNQTYQVRLSDYIVVDHAFRMHQSVKPGFFHSLFSTRRYQDWLAIDREKSIELRQSKNSKEDIEYRLEALKIERTNLIHSKQDLSRKHGEESISLERDKNECVSILHKHDGIKIDHDFFSLSHSEKQQSAPWLNQQMQKARQDLFVAAIKLHKAFIDGAAQPIRHNLNAFFDGYAAKSLGNDKRDKVFPSLWTTFSLVVPLFSTTFASINRMLSKVEANSFGWLLIDEAGQATPQSAVGAILRSKRAVVVGDPIQIEPVVVLPDKLTESICRQFGVDPQIYNAPIASVQTLADSCTPYFGTFETNLGSREVGIPLLVHRRCSSPMFDISNMIAYENLMVQAKKNGHSNIQKILGNSKWISIQSTSTDKWSHDEGEAVLSMLRQLKENGGQPDLYIVTPFVVVQDNLRTLLKASGILNGWIEDAQWIYNRIGTVHTVQGREAEAVILVLGAPNPSQNGARAWAGGRPNLLNVAVTRAKEVLYVIGDRNLWQTAGVFNRLSMSLGGGDA